MKLRYLLILLIILSITSLFVGVSSLSILNLFNLSEYEMQILMASRIPRLVSILIAGAGISICGLIMQQLTRNKFVSPTTAGTMDAARLGILISILLFGAAGLLQQLVFAFGFALLGTYVFMKILDKIRFQDTIFVPLVGLMFGSILSSISTFFAYQFDLIQSISSFLHGDFSLIIRGQYELLYVAVPVIALTYFYADRFTVAGMGEDFAKNLGLNYRQVVNIGLMLVALVTASVVLTVGVIPFLGLIIPNIVSIYQGDNIRKNLSHTAVLGAVFVLACDIIGRLIIYPYEVSISLTVGILGSAIFIYLLMRRQKHGL
ncbi:ABC transporter permease [Thalassobacillus sp. C254]|uniref:ABC transporter permease n=1 Tax=Thalassobacillus sp. C254 TaxID=1225341 RepID=UPI0006D0548F|nr:ABC transporter permease [Thalassobacillus sp. C254]